MIFLRLHFPAKVGSYFLDTKELGTGELSDGFTAWKCFTSENPGVPKARSLKEVSLFLERFCWKWVSSAGAEVPRAWPQILPGLGQPPQGEPSTYRAPHFTNPCTSKLVILVAELPQAQATR